MDWMPIMSKANLREMVACWVVALAVLYIMQWRSKRAAGIPLAFALNLSLIHLTGAFAYTFDYYTPHGDVLTQMGFELKNTFIGFWCSLIGFAVFVLGTGLAFIIFKPLQSQPLDHPWTPVTKKLPGTLLIFASLFFLFGPILRRIPSLASVSVVLALTSP